MSKNKMTKKEYEAKKIELENKLQSLKAAEEALKVLFASVEINNSNREYFLQIGETANKISDDIYDLEKEIYCLEDEWNKRNWTHQDYVEYSLICNNID